MKFSPSCMEAMWERWRSLALTHAHTHTLTAHARREVPRSRWDLQTEAERRCRVNKLAPPRQDIRVGAKRNVGGRGWGTAEELKVRSGMTRDE